MKEYKVGDTVYVKGKIKQIDEDDTSLPYYVDFGNTVWIPSDTIIDELPTSEPVKPVLPKDVADELEDMKMRGASFAGYVSWFLEGSGTTYNWLVGRGVLTDDYVLVLSNAWYNGYTIEQEPRYKVYVTGTNKQYMYVKRGELAKAHNKKATPITPQSIVNYITAGGNRDLYWFTDEEITKFDLQDCEKESVADD